MKKLAFAIAAVLATSGTLLADDMIVKDQKAVLIEQAQRPAKRPVLDTTVTNSVRRPASESQPKPDRAPSGIEVNPWIVPSFM